MNRTTAVIASIGVAAVLAIFAATNQAAVREAVGMAEVPSVRGDLKVSWEVPAEEGKTRTFSDVLCSSIDFHPEYLVLKYKLGGGRVLPLRDLRSLQWTGK